MSAPKKVRERKVKAVNPTRQHSMKCPKLYGKKCACDGYHTFDELYEHRITLFFQLCRVLDNPRLKKRTWRSKLHSDGSSFDGWFVMGFGKEKGEQITYHIPMRYWPLAYFAEELERAPEWDGHTSADVLERLKRLDGRPKIIRIKKKSHA